MPTLLTPAVRDILEASTIVGSTLELPPERLDPKLYKAVNVHIENAGGKWNRSQQKHLFTGDAKTALGMVLAEGESVNHAHEHKKKRQAFYTPRDIAQEVAELARVSGHTVLEPSAGHGALAVACMRAGAKSVHCIEIDEVAAATLEDLQFERRVEPYRVQRADFLLQTPAPHYERIVMNPPFTRGQDVKHITHALDFLAPGGELYAIVPDGENPRLSSDAVTITRFAKGAFREAGTEIATRLIMFRRLA